MTVSPKDSRLMLLISSVLIVVPMVIFPEKLGTELSSGSFAYAIFEVIYYGAVFFIMRPASSIFQLFQGAGLTFLCRLAIGSVFGVLISIMYDVGFSTALTLGISKYLPAIILHITCAPLVMRPFYLAILGEASGDELRRDKKRSAVYQSQTASSSPSTTSQIIVKPESSIPKPTAIEKPKATVSVDKDTDGFDRAVKYIGEHHAVKLAAVVDFEGLTMASFARGEARVDEWAPMALLFNEANTKILNRLSATGGPERLDITMEQDKLYAIKVSEYTLLVLSSRDDDDLLGIRLAQASEMISKYVSERYGKLLSASPEEKYVPST